MQPWALHVCRHGRIYFVFGGVSVVPKESKVPTFIQLFLLLLFTSANALHQSLLTLLAFTTTITRDLPLRQ